MSIYLSNNVFLTATGETNPNNPLIGYQSVLTRTDITASEPNANRPAINMWAPDTAAIWEGPSYSGPSQTTEVFITLSNGGGAAIDYIGIAKHNFVEGGYEYVLQESTDGGLNYTNVTTPRIVSSDTPIMDYFDSRTSGLFRIKLSKTGTTMLAPLIAHVKLGAALVLQRRIYVGHRPATIAKQVKKISHGSESGQYLGSDIIRSFYTAQVQQNNNSPAFIRQNIAPFISHVNGEIAIDDTAPQTFFFAWRPQDYPNEILYGWTDDNITPENQGSDDLGGRMSWGFTMQGVA